MRERSEKREVGENGRNTREVVPHWGYWLGSVTSEQVYTKQVTFHFQLHATLDQDPLTAQLMVPPSSPVWRHLNSSDHASSAVSLPATTSGCRLALKNLCISPSRMVPLFWLSNFWNTWKKKYLSNFPLDGYFPPSLPPFSLSCPFIHPSFLTFLTSAFLSSVISPTSPPTHPSTYTPSPSSRWPQHLAHNSCHS